ncbi:sugar phosphate isomerase/epimerase family protein [Aureimonas mangrovi]|uniref:sugar phosphate isomerase/epimerase family protein n=1 Tax=Aureimonas mangrovi TaxID=2758041 RepID=UPI00163DB872|nr:sugar phosphate isomerase/epimerase family protein [Aureimonas mangrovi]
MTDLPLLGAALMIDDLAVHRDFIVGEGRDLELQDFIDGDTLGGDWQPLVARAKALLDGHEGRLGLHGPFYGLPLAARDREVRALVTRRLEQGLAVCAALGATQMVIHSPYTTWDHNNLDARPGAGARVVELVHETLRPIVQRAEDIGCTLVIENIEDKDPDIRCTLAESFGTAAVAVSLDTGHAHYAHRSTGGPPVDFYVARAGERLAHVHLQDADGHADRHWRIGRGSVDWHAVFAALARLQTMPRLLLELDDLADIPASARYLMEEGLVR